MEEEYNHLLTFELVKDKDELHICTDESGLEFLIEELTRLLSWVKNEKTEHIHLMTKEWGDGELSSESQVGEILNHVKIYCWNKRGD